MMNIVQNVINMYKTDPIKFLLIIAVIYLLLKQSNVIENLRPSKVQGEVNLQALSTVSQLAQKWNNAVEIDNTGNVNFKKKVTLGGDKITLEQDGKISNIGGFNVTPTGTLNAGHINAISGGNITVSGNIISTGTIKAGGKSMHLISKFVRDNSETDLNYNANDSVCIHAGMNLDWNNHSPGRIEAYCFVK